MNNNEFLINNAFLEIQPKQNFHYRYASELAGNTHGGISGQCEEDYTKLKLLLPENGCLDNFGNKRDFYVLCSIHCNNNKVLSPHLLMLKKETQLNYNFIFEKMEEVYGKELERIWKLREYVIVRLTAANYSASFQNKRKQYERLELPLPFENILGDLDLNNARRVKESSKLNVCLGLTIFEKDFYTNTFSLYRDTIFSCNIYHGDDLRIHRLCHIKGSIFGGTEVTILIRLESNLPLNVNIKRVNELTKQTLWSTVVEIKKNEIFANAAVTFRMPPYRGPTVTDDEIEVFLCLRIGNTTYKSNDVRFYYINQKTSKRKRQEEQNFNMESKEKILRRGHTAHFETPMATLDEFRLQIERKRFVLKMHIDQVFGNETSWPFQIGHDNLDSLFYDALQCPEMFTHLYKAAMKSAKKCVVANHFDESGENLLHLACKMDLYERIRYLIELGCYPHEQDNMGRTFLHIALETKKTKCILEIKNLIENYSQYPKEVEENLIKMFKVYNNNGHTVLHEAVLGEETALCEIMFLFLLKHDMNILDYEVLGSGDTIAHLVYKNNATMMWPLMQKYVLNYENIGNYAGTTLTDLKESENISEEELLEGSGN